MIVETKEIYKCEYCRKLYQKKHACEYHELLCTKNPENFRACFGCQHLDKKEAVYYFDAWDGSHEGTANVLYCKKKDIYVYPPQIEIKGNNRYEDSLDKENEAMPKECDLKSTGELYYGLNE